MADSIVKLRVDSKEYDARINSARQGLLAMEQACRKVGGTFEVVEKEELAFVKALGQMDTQAGTTKGKLRELTNTINDLTTMYKGMTDLERQGEFGKAMEASIKQLKGRAADLQDQMADLNEELKHMSSDTGFTDGMRNMTGVIGSCASAVVAFTGDSKELDVVIKDLAKIQTTVAAVEALTKAFQKQNLVMLKNPYVLAATAIAAVGVAIYELSTKENEAAQKIKMADDAIKSQVDTLISLEKVANGAASAIGNLTKSQANAQYDSALGDLGSIQGAMQQQQAFIRNIERALQAAKSKTLFGTRDEALANKDERARLEQQLKDQKEVYRQMVEEAKKADKAVAEANAKFRRAKDDPATGGTSTSSPKPTEYTYNGIDTVVLGSIEAQEAKIKDLTELWRQAGTQGVRDEYAKRIENANAELDRMKGKVPQTATGFSGPSTSAFSAWASELQKQMATVDVTTPLYQNLQAQLADTTALQNIIGYAFQNGISLDSIDLDVENFWDKILNAEDISNADWQGITNAINEQLKGLGIEPIKLNVNTGGFENLAKDAKSTGTEFQKAASAIGSVGSALQAIEDPGAKVAGILAQAIANIALTFASSLRGTFTPWDWIAAAAAGTATMISTIAAIKSATEYHAEGGFVGSGPRGTDTVNTWLTPGELVLNASQQQNLASNLTSNGGGGGTATTTIKGEQLITVINNTRKRKGKGEIL